MNETESARKSHLALEAHTEIACCPRCWHEDDRPCPDLIRCLQEGPVCHQDDDCRVSRIARRETLTRKVRSRPVIFIGTGTCGLGAGAQKSLAAARRYIEERGLDGEIVEVGCIGLCSAEPLIDIQVPGRTRVSFNSATAEKVAPILDAILGGHDDEVVKRAIMQHRDPEGVDRPWDGVPFMDEHPFFAPQTRWVLAGCGIADPGRCDEAIARGAWRAYSEMLHTETPAEVCSIVEASGLRGRGGGGFPTGRKWKIALAAQGEQKYLICNADEGDPGAFMDRAVIEGDPHRLLEGIAIAAYAIGATKAVIYIRAEYPLAIARLKVAIEQARAYGLLGKNILDSGVRLDIGIKMGAGAFVCGEETALIHSIEGKRGMPRPRPPFPAVDGLFRRPTVINNVETLANLPAILSRGPKWFADVGTATSKGTKVFAISGKVQRTGLVEVAMGTAVRKIIFDIAGGPLPGRTYKAAQIGGPSGGCIPEQHLDIDIDYESLKTVGAMMGSGGLVVMDDRTCMVDVAKFFMDFIQRESCGKCIPCREGTRRMLDILQGITRARRSEAGVQALERFQGVLALRQLAKVIQDTSLCGLGQSAPNPVLSTLRWFPDEYEAHVYDRRCPAHVCTELLLYSIDPKKCKGCLLCGRACPSEAIMGAPKSPHYIIPDKCIGCGSCLEVCRLGAVVAS
jgi:NADH:ubiquinone oxidoreductase subunit F (NADH-binding)/NAD-dependent dihydropyrimidine dehydrogenase PreA subunit